MCRSARRMATCLPERKAARHRAGARCHCPAHRRCEAHLQRCPARILRSAAPRQSPRHDGRRNWPEGPSRQRHHQPGRRSEHHPDRRRTGAASDYDTAKNRMLDDSRSRAGRNVIGLLAGPTPNSTTSQTKSIAASALPNCTATSPTKRSRTTAPASSTAQPSSRPSSRARSSKPCRRARLFSGARPRRYRRWMPICWKRPRSCSPMWPTRCSTAMSKHLFAPAPTPPRNS
jgi:hypothetical protein